jgi:hypothetical protein
MALVHHPVLDRDGGIVATSVTNLDVHDLARSARTYGLAGLVVVTPIEAQRRIVERIIEYWNEPAHARRIPRRREALELVRHAASIEEACALVGGVAGTAPLVVGTSARPDAGRTGWPEARREIHAHPETPRLLVVGTGWGLADEALARCASVLAPIEGSSGYNHLSVRAAAAVILDRLLGSQGPEGAGPQVG